MTDHLGRYLIEDTRRRLQGLAEQVRTCLAALSDSDIWDRAHEKANSVGNLVLHVCGSTRHFLGRGVGGSDYRRDRPAEFAEKGPVARDELIRVLDDTLAESDRVLAGLTPDRLMEANDRTGRTRQRTFALRRAKSTWSCAKRNPAYWPTSQADSATRASTSKRFT